jgi:hypothetical protein
MPKQNISHQIQNSGKVFTLDCEAGGPYELDCRNIIFPSITNSYHPNPHDLDQGLMGATQTLSYQQGTATVHYVFWDDGTWDEYTCVTSGCVRTNGGTYTENP